ncbi:MAG: hypothetical protein IPH36_06885 [Saprospiraceae bacterium]|nr:hypothetical protein [Saprospiraceae bacterium]
MPIIKQRFTTIALYGASTNKWQKHHKKTKENKGIKQHGTKLKQKDQTLDGHVKITFTCFILYK